MLLPISEGKMDDGDGELFGAAEVLKAAELSRGTFLSWASRHDLQQIPAGGMGRERKFTFLDAVRLAATVELTRSGISISQATKAAATIDEFNLALRQALVLWKGALSTGNDATKESYNVGLAPIGTPGDFEMWLRLTTTNGDLPRKFTFLDISEITERTRCALCGQELPSPDVVDSPTEAVDAAHIKNKSGTTTRAMSSDSAPNSPALHAGSVAKKARRRPE